MNHVVIKHSSRARRVALRLDVKERVVNLIVPKGMSLKKAQRFADEHSSWIEEKIAELAPVIPYEDGRILPIIGQDRQIDLYVDPSMKRTDITLRDQYLHVKTNKDDPASRIERFLKNLARDVLGDMAREKAAQIDKTITSISIRDTKSRWGSCAEDGSISFSWRLIFAPSAAMDYVVAHEVAHLVHLNHSRAFWNLCKDLSLDYVEGEYWMRNHGHELMRFGG